DEQISGPLERGVVGARQRKTHRVPVAANQFSVGGGNRRGDIAGEDATNLVHRNVDALQANRSGDRLRLDVAAQPAAPLPAMPVAPGQPLMPLVEFRTERLSRMGVEGEKEVHL